MILLWSPLAALAAGPVDGCVPVTADDLLRAAEQVRAGEPADEAVGHDPVIAGILSRLPCSDPALTDDPWAALLLAEAHRHHPALLSEAPREVAEAHGAATGAVRRAPDPAPPIDAPLAVRPVGEPPVAAGDAPGAADTASDDTAADGTAADGTATDGAPEPEAERSAGPPAPEEEGLTGRIRIRSPVPVRLEGWTGTFGAGKLPTGRYVVIARFPPAFDAQPQAVIELHPGEVWTVRCSREGSCEASR